MSAFATLAVLLVFAAAALVVVPLLRQKERPASVAAALVALAIPAAVLVTYLLVSSYRWGAPPVPAAEDAGMQGDGQGGSPGSLEDALARLEARLAKNPDNIDDWVLLGSTYANLERPADAIKAYQHALDLSGGQDINARLGLAEARIMADPAAINGPAGDEIESVLAAEPRNPTALWFGGLLALNRGDAGLARSRWQALLDLNPPEQVRQFVSSQLAELGGQPGAASSASGSPGAASANSAKSAATGPAVEVRVDLDPAVRGRISPNAPLFVFVRDASGGGPPLAVIRRQAGELPITVRITDADVMMPGRSLASLTQGGKVVARVANGGDPVPKPGDVFGEAPWKGEQSLAVTLNQVVP